MSRENETLTQLEKTETAPEFDSPEVQKAIQTLLKGTRLERRLFLILCTLIFGLTIVVPSRYPLYQILRLLTMGVIFGGGHFASLIVRKKRVHEAYHLLMTVNDVRVIPVFNKIKRLKIGFYPVEIEKRLVYLYSFLTAIDVNLISEQEKRDCALEVINLVHRAHGEYENAPRTESVIEEIRWRVRLLALAGGEKEYRQIVNLETARMGNARQKEIREWVFSVLPAWRERLDLGDTPKMLLRPSHIPDGELLHPVTGQKDEDENQLLRPKE